MAYLSRVMDLNEPVRLKRYKLAFMNSLDPDQYVHSHLSISDTIL